MHKARRSQLDYQQEFVVVLVKAVAKKSGGSRVQPTNPTTSSS